MISYVRNVGLWKRGHKQTAKIASDLPLGGRGRRGREGAFHASLLRAFLFFFLLSSNEGISGDLC